MSEADIAREISYRFEAKKDALRQVQDGGVKVTLVIHPQEMPPALYGDPMGQRYVIAMVPLNDDETPRTENVQKPQSFAGQAKLLSQDEQFWGYLSVNYDFTPTGSDQAEIWIERECDVASCSEIIEGTPAGIQFKRIQRDYNRWVNTPPVSAYEGQQ